jgi:hypothetical protein
MSLKSWWQARRRRGRSKSVVASVPSTRPLREFVYLDEVSLRSLLVSQKDTIPEQVSRAMSQAEEAELTGKFSGGSDLVGKAEVGSRYQTSNSNSIQSSRKAIVQTLFNELREDSNPTYALVLSSEAISPAESVEDIVRSTEDPSKGSTSASLTRGVLVEVEVDLEVDPVFKFGTQIAEYSAMSEEYPEMFDTSGRTTLAAAGPVNKVLHRFLAGLIPIRARAVNLSVVEIGGLDYVVHNALLSGLTVEARPLEVVGVTEHLGYWKDIRRVLFSSARVTMLCRVARDGLHQSWTPIKLADLFRDVAPDLVAQLDAASRSGVAPQMAATSARSPHSQLDEALRSYQERLEESSGAPLDAAETASLEEALSELPQDESPSTQRRAFALVRQRVEKKAGSTLLDAQADLVARQEARDSAGLTLFPAFGSTGRPDNKAESQPRRNEDDRLLDVEVVAIYW